jgi:hypothetical protein
VRLFPSFSVLFGTLKRNWSSISKWTRTKKKRREAQASTSTSKSQITADATQTTSPLGREVKSGKKALLKQRKKVRRPKVGLTTFGQEYSPIHVHPKDNSLPGAVLRKSLRWYEMNLPVAHTGWHIPFYDDLGRRTGHTLAVYSCDPRTYVASCTATVARRLVNYCRRHNNWNEVAKRLGPLCQVSFLYAVTKNDYMWDRILTFCRDLQKFGKLIHRIMLKFLVKTDENVRFVYSHVSFQTQWLLFRARAPRDKSVLESRMKSFFVKRRTTSEREFLRYDAITEISSKISRIKSF